MPDQPQNLQHLHGIFSLCQKKMPLLQNGSPDILPVRFSCPRRCVASERAGNGPRAPTATPSKSQTVSTPYRSAGCARRRGNRQVAPSPHRGASLRRADLPFAGTWQERLQDRSRWDPATLAANALDSRVLEASDGATGAVADEEQLQ